MLRMLYVPSEIKNIKGRPKVYFCCHPKDFDRYFDTLSKDVLSKQKCTIWYAENLTAPRDEEYLEDLRQMQLFLMPVTSNLLYKDNIALSVEFAFAMESHIPVLPVMLEPSLEGVFNKKCGDLQYLDKYSADSTAISYDEKLSKYLEAVLVGDEVAQKVRDAFDAYIFLSYRKKDRRYAQELMRLIHKNEFCRDIAIWYDEFLGIGEDFNENIAESLNKSQLFALAVTPNLINEKNYVQSTEYPMAVKKNKVIIPAELVPTDREQLREKFEGIPEMIDARDEFAMYHMMRYALGSIILKEKEKSPEHNYLIGLAYLSGIDVEVNNSRALELINFSAQAGLVEAVGKLVEMYRNGMGVKRDHHTAIEWQEKKVEILKKKYREKPDANLLHELSAELLACGELYNEIGCFSEALQHYTDVMFSVMVHGYPDEEKVLLRDLIVCYERLAGIYMSQREYKFAGRYIEKAIGLCERLAAESGNDKSFFDLSICYYRMGVILRTQGDLQGGLIYHNKSLEINKSLSERTDSCEFCRAVCWDYLAIGGIKEALGDLQGAFDYYSKAFEIEEKLFAETDALQESKDLAICCNSIGETLMKLGDLQKAKIWFNKAIELMEYVTQKTGAMSDEQTLSQHYVNVGDILGAQGNKQEALEYYSRALAMRENLVAKAPTPYYLEMLAYAYCNVASVCTTRARECLNNAMSIFENLAVNFPEREQWYMEKAFLVKNIISNL